MKKHSRFASFIFTLLFAGLLPLCSMAQPGDPGDDTDLPVDGGLAFLVAAGIGYGIKKWGDERKRTTSKIQ